MMVHRLSDVQSANIGDGTRIWQYVIILEGARVGRNCNICSHVFIENDVTVGDDVTIKCGVQLWDGVTIYDRAFIGPNATFVNDHLPRSKRHGKPVGRTVIMEGASIGANATIMCGLQVGRYAMVGGGAVITKNVGDYELWYGNPARHAGYVSADGEAVELDLRGRTSACRYLFVDGDLIRR